MKARDYAKKLQDLQAAGEPLHEACTTILFDFIKEVPALVESRHVKGADALRAVFKELDNKWEATCRLCPELPRQGFFLAVKALMPEIWKELVVLMPEIEHDQEKG